VNEVVFILCVEKQPGFVNTYMKRNEKTDKPRSLEQRPRKKRVLSQRM
jgi:hypothetical protein